MFSLDPSISVALLDFRLGEAQLRRAGAQFRASAAHYCATVLNAVREVQNDLSALRWLAGEERQSKAAAAAKALDMATAQYRDGASSCLDVVSAQNAALQAQQAPTADSASRANSTLAAPRPRFVEDHPRAVRDAPAPGRHPR
jgi:outer membrane protein TolC